MNKTEPCLQKNGSSSTQLHTSSIGGYVRLSTQDFTLLLDIAQILSGGFYGSNTAELIPK